MEVLESCWEKKGVWTRGRRRRCRRRDIRGIRGKWESWPQEGNWRTKRGRTYYRNEFRLLVKLAKFLTGLGQRIF